MVDIIKIIEEFEKRCEDNPVDYELNDDEKFHLFFFNKMFQRDFHFRNFMLVIVTLYSDSRTNGQTDRLVDLTREMSETYFERE